MANIYVYDPTTGHISYSIDGATGQKVAVLTAKGIPHIVLDSVGMLNQYVVVDENNNPTGVDTFNQFSITANKNSIIADGQDEIVFSNIVEGTSVYVGESKVWTSTSEDTTFEFSVDGYNYSSPILTFKKYGYQDFRIPVMTTIPPIED
jgi:hypothetical protein